MQISIEKIITPKKYALEGLWLGPKKAKITFIFLHGLGGTVFSRIDILKNIADAGYPVLTFNNRGSTTISRIKKLKKNKTGYDFVLAGEVHEVFEECLDDIAGAVNLAKKKGAKNIFLIGHSTGSQKSAYYLSKNPDRSVRGAILLAPMSDYAGIAHITPKGILKKAVAQAKKMVRQGDSHGTLPKNIWPYPYDAQRFLSLYTPDSTEEIFSYAQPQKNPATLKKIRKPLLVVLAGNDEYKDRPISEIKKWFDAISLKTSIKTEIIKNAPHNFYAYSNELKKLVVGWVQDNI